MEKKVYRVLILVFIITFLNFNPDQIGGMSGVRTPRYVENSRLVNSLSDLDNYSYIDRSVNSFMKYWDLNGATVAVAKGGKLVFAKGYGYPDTDSTQIVQPYNRFRIASVSKLVTATAIMKLVETGNINLDDKVFGPDGILNDEYFSNPRDKRAYDISVEHLLSHEGGWITRYGDHMFMPFVVASSLGIETPVRTEDIVRFALNKRLHFTPGRGRSYSNLGYAILGLVIEKVSGMPYDVYCKKNLFEPLGLYDFELAGNLYSEKGTLEVRYFEPSNAIPLKSIYGGDELVPASYGGNDIEALGGAGAWTTTATDLVRFVMAIDGFDDPPDILSPWAVNYMTNQSNHVAPVGWKGAAKNGYWWRTGSFAGTSAMIERRPDGTIWAVVFNTNTWKQSMFPSDVRRMMSRAISGTRTWLDDDLFRYYMPLPVEQFDYLHE